MNISEMLNRWKEIKAGLQGDFVKDALEPRREEIMRYQYQQLFEGKDNKGNDIRPYYSEDLKPSGYFRSRESADRYAAWKMTGIPYPFRANRNPDAPNLYITGKFHEELEALCGADAVGVVPKTAYAAEIYGKYGAETFGLSGENWSEVLNNGVYDEVFQRMIDTINNGN